MSCLFIVLWHPQCWSKWEFLERQRAWQTPWVRKGVRNGSSLNKAQHTLTLLWLHGAAGGGSIQYLINPKQLMYPAGLNATELLGISLQSCSFSLYMLHVDVGLQALQNPHPCLSQVYWGSLGASCWEQAQYQSFPGVRKRASCLWGWKISPKYPEMWSFLAVKMDDVTWSGLDLLSPSRADPILPHWAWTKLLSGSCWIFTPMKPHELFCWQLGHVGRLEKPVWMELLLDKL